MRLSAGSGLLLALAVGLMCFDHSLSAFAESHPRPTALLLSADGTTAWIAHHRPASIVIVNLSSGAAESWPAPGAYLHDLTAWNDQSALALVDEPVALIRLDRQETRPELKGRWSGIDTANRVRVAADGKTIAVSSLLQRWIKLITADALIANDAIPWRQVDVPFSPGELLWLPDHRHLLVAEAFGGRLAVIDAAVARLVSVREIPAHNISGLAQGRDGQRVFLTHQTIHRGAQTSFDDIHWGGLLTNVVRSVAVVDVLNPASDILAHTVVFQLGDVGRGAGDPAGIAVRADGLLAVTLAGVNEVTFNVEADLKWKRIGVGTRPRSVALTADGKRAVVLNDLDDTLSIVPLNSTTEETVQTVRLGESLLLSAVERGERLFFNARLSHDGWFSCHSCHTDGHSNRQLVDNLTDGTTGTPKRVLSLRGVRDTAPYGWDGHLPTLADEVRHSVTSTMQGTDLTDAEVSDLVAFLETIPPWPESELTNERVAHGREIFERENCLHCHAPATYTTPKTYDVGLSDQRGRRLFNPPSLRGLRHGGPYFHHGQAESLQDVLGRFRHQLRQNLSPDDEANLIKFLESF